MVSMKRMLAALAAVTVWGVGEVTGQTAATEAYLGEVAEFFSLPAGEVDILSEWRLPPQEIPVVLFMARRAGVSAEALAQLRRAGRGWSELAERYHLDPTHFHVPLAEDAAAGPLDEAYGQYRALPASRWSEVRLSGNDILILVNVRVIAQSLKRSPEEVLTAYGSTPDFVALYARLAQGGRGGL